MENREIAKQVYPDVEGYLDQVEHDRIQFIRGLEYSNEQNKAKDDKINELEKLYSISDNKVVILNNENKQLLDEIERLNASLLDVARKSTDKINEYQRIIDEQDNTISQLQSKLKAADSVNENLSKQVEWISVEDRLPIANESGAWDGKRSDVYLGKYKDGTYCLFRIYEGFLDGSDFIEYYDENDNSINAPVYYKSIT